MLFQIPMSKQSATLFKVRHILYILADNTGWIRLDYIAIRQHVLKKIDMSIMFRSNHFPPTFYNSPTLSSFLNEFIFSYF